MAGGIGILLLLILLVAGIALAIAMYLTGGALWFGRSDAKKDRVEGREADGEEARPLHTHPTSEYHENTEFVGTGQRDSAERDER